MLQIFIVDDDWLSVKMTTFILQEAGYRVSKAFDARNVLAMIERDQPDLILLDIGLPSQSGFELCRAIRHSSTVPIIFLSGSAALADRVRSLEIGGDDYIAKPFEPAELLARIGAVLRRSEGMRRPPHTKLTIGDLTIDTVHHRALFADGRVLGLTPIEFQILHVLARHAGQLMSDDQLMQLVWGAPAKGRNVLTVYIYRLRAKLWPNQASPIVTLRGQGYMFRRAGDTGPIGDERALGAERCGPAARAAG